MAEPTRLYLVRHGRVADPWRERIYGDLDVPLAPEGERVSRLVAARVSDLGPALVVSSGLERADYLARSIARAGAIEHRMEPRLREIHRGEWAGLAEAEVEARRPGGWQAFWGSEGLVPPPGGETIEEVRVRVLAALDELAAAFSGRAVAVVAHKWALRAALCETLALPLAEAARLPVPYCGTAVCDWPSSGRTSGREGRPALLSLNAFALTEASG